MRLVDKNGDELKVGAKVKTFRGEDAKITGIYPPGTSGGGNGGRVALRFAKKKLQSNFDPLYFPSVIDASFRND